MIGNDIVDLQLAKHQSNWQRKGWLQKVFTASEIQEIVSSEVPEITVWKFWSMKEAVYKAHQRRFNLSPKFNPKSFECSTAKEKNETVQIKSYVYSTNTQITKQYVYTTTAFASPQKTVSKIFENHVDLQVYVKQEIGNRLNIDPQRIAFDKNAHRIPLVYIDQKEVTISVSITHHGTFFGALFSF
ncbi:4'-phosphopantetheinyl transferase family protein [Aquimarina pacifica]|uniref:4'-phosphopantetheinyl transferase family protein n=1 Tax=Aquimarina pacifica TaxID=1296415 RepID=UPI0004729F8B|nr:4'-phosphopantetheinyl transferase superfamily protein [Aquimarina pacifica]